MKPQSRLCSFLYVLSKKGFDYPEVLNSTASRVLEPFTFYGIFYEANVTETLCF